MEKFQKDRLEQFDAELYRANNISTPSKTTSIYTEAENGLAKLKTETNGEENPPSMNYIESMKSKQYKPFKVDRRPRGPLRSKLIQFCEDVRPPYFGTWQKKSARVTGRRPYARDESVFDYEVDSEAEWDIGGPGESLKGDDSEDEEEMDDYEIDMKTFVPHGYVSDDEIEVHSDQEDNGSSSANQSAEDIVSLDTEEDSNVSVKIVGEKRVKLMTISSTKQQNQSNNINNGTNQSNGNKKVTPTIVDSPQLPTAVLPSRQPKLDIKPILLGIYYENQQPSIMSESKIHFLRGFQGFLCN